MKTVTFQEYVEGDLVLIDLNTCPPHMEMDYIKRNENVSAGKELCDNCDGTGNEFFSMYKECSACCGRGHK